MVRGATEKLTGGEALVRSLIAEGIQTVFGLPGIQLDPMFNALHDAGNAISVINARHEQGTAYMAYGYAQSTGKIGAYAVVPGPGLLNTTAALSTAASRSAFEASGAWAKTSSVAGLMTPKVLSAA